MGHRFITTNAATAVQANKLATIKAQNICDLENNKLKLISQKTIYHGLNQKQQNLVELAQEFLPASKTDGTYIPADYQYCTTLIFECE